MLAPDRAAIGRCEDLGNCLIWDHRSQKPIRQWKAHQGSVQDLKWSGDGLASFRPAAMGWSALGCQRGGARKSVAHPGRQAGGLGSDGKTIASAGTDGVIQIWPAENRPSPLVMDTQFQGTLDLTWDNESSDLLLASGNAGKIGVWEARSGKKLEEIPLAQAAPGGWCRSAMS